MTDYYRPIVCNALPMPDGALPLAGGPLWFTHAMRHVRGAEPVHVAVQEIPQDWQDRLSAPRAAMAGLTFDRPHIMGILNVTPDSFSDGGSHNGAAQALTHARQMASDGATIIDVGGESTRPGAITVPPEAEIARIEPVIRAIAHEVTLPISIDTRKSSVAEAAFAVGAKIVNDVSGFTYDPMLGQYCADQNLPVCVMHTQGEPETMHLDPHYDDVLLDVYDFLETQVQSLEAMGIMRSKIIVDPGIGFGKTIDHNLTVLHGMALFHGLGCPVLIGASRKGFIGKISGANPASARMPGSVSVALAAVAQGMQIVRVHDVAETAQAISIWQAISQGAYYDA
ncbi:dihydropteroate synthase [Tropicibacter naphthalenivorans]|uniref:Dihydropteroate synthase n=1 Tax=Tropicibacter naphthalenivorans TaxID=441103 RepID=A0A0P1G404_9RHOB|nr:dihydropteroate synthase [Tropicibacter naphthalenivorans]CUH76568.1 Dihydropteroate synthase [Tropicibacter naphthalenivorans]SMC65084.1 dihydropteroate synthase [Tropicibacter naphthalenivorans]